MTTTVAADKLLLGVFYGVFSFAACGLLYQMDRAFTLDFKREQLRMKGFNTTKDALRHKYETIQNVHKLTISVPATKTEIDEAMIQVMCMLEYDPEKLGSYVQNIVRAQCTKDGIISKKNLTWKIQSDPCPNGACHETCTKAELIRALSDELIKTI